MEIINVQYPCLEDKLKHTVYKFCVLLYACLFSLGSIGQSEVHIRACKCGAGGVLRGKKDRDDRRKS